MEVVRFRVEEESARIGYLDDESVVGLDIDRSVDSITDEEVRSERREAIYDRSEVQLLAPVEPSTIARLDNCYTEGIDVDEHLSFLDPGTGRPSFWATSTSALAGPNEAVPIPEVVADVRPGVELGIVIGETASGLAPAEAEAAIAGYTVCRTFTAHDDHPGPYGYRMFPGFLGVGPTVSPTLPTDAELRIEHEGAELDAVSIGSLRFTLAELVSYSSEVTTLQPGDLVTTGNPLDVERSVAPGESVSAWIDGLEPHRTTTTERAFA